jgi:hypothetical protein
MKRKTVFQHTIELLAKRFVEIRRLRAQIVELQRDQSRLNWMIREGLAPAKFRAWKPEDGELKNYPFGLVKIGDGDRETIDELMKLGGREISVE